MDEKIKMYITLFIACITIVILSLGVFTSDFDSDMVGSSDTSAAKSTMTSEELELFLADDVNNFDEFVVENNDSNQEVIESKALEEEFPKEEILVSNSSGEIPNYINLPITFYPQAPDADWSLPWKEACEESSIIQAYYFVKGKSLTRDIFRSEILSIVETQESLLGQYIDTNMADTGKFLEAHYGYNNYEIIDNPSIEDMKKELAEGHPIVAPFAGKELGNIYFSDGGPRYHVLVIVGYDENGFITNDVGTSRGENFPYSYNTIMNALHDLVPLGEGDILDGEKRILVMR